MTERRQVNSIGRRSLFAVTGAVESRFPCRSSVCRAGIASGTQDPRNLYKEEIQVYELTGGVELVPLLTSRRYQSHPPTTRYVVTDATRPGYTIDS